MKLQKQTAYEYEGKEYCRYAVFLPKKVIEKVGWQAGDRLEAHISEEGGHLIVKKVGVEGMPKKEPKMVYSEFKERVEGVLKDAPEGLTWTKVRERANLYQKLPNNLWVRLLESDIGLVRERIGRRIFWRLR